MPLIGRPPIGHREVVELMVEQLINHVDLHGGTARTAPRPFKGLGQFFVETTLRAIFQEDPPKGRQEGRGKLRIEGVKLLAQRQLQDLLHIRHGLRGIDALLEGLGCHGGLRMWLLEKIAQPAQGHRRIVQHVGRSSRQKNRPRSACCWPVGQSGSAAPRLPTAREQTGR